MKTKKKSGKTLRKSGKSQGKIREFDGIKKVGTLYIDLPPNPSVEKVEVPTEKNFKSSKNPGSNQPRPISRDANKWSINEKRNFMMRKSQQTSCLVMKGWKREQSSVNVNIFLLGLVGPRPVHFVLYQRWRNKFNMTIV